MARSRLPSAYDAALLRALEARGVFVELTQLERLRIRGLAFPPPRPRLRGYQAGYEPPPEDVDRTELGFRLFRRLGRYDVVACVLVAGGGELARGDIAAALLSWFKRQRFPSSPTALARRTRPGSVDGGDTVPWWAQWQQRMRPSEVVELLRDATAEEVTEVLRGAAEQTSTVPPYDLEPRLVELMLCRAVDQLAGTAGDETALDVFREAVSDIAMTRRERRVADVLYPGRISGVFYSQR